MTYKFHLQSNFAITTTNKVARISIRYINLFNDDSRITHCNQPDVVRYFYEEGNYSLAWYDQAKPAVTHESDFIPWVTKRFFNSNGIRFGSSIT